MTGWMPLTGRSAALATEFTGFARTNGKASFQGLNKPMPPVVTALPEAEDASNPNFTSNPETEQTVAKPCPTPQQSLEAEHHAIVTALNADIERLKLLHQAELKTAEEKFAAELAELAALFPAQHKAAVEDLLEKVTRCTADVLRPLLNSAASEAAVKDFTGILGELLKDKSAVEFTAQISETFYERFRQILPADFEIIPSPFGEPNIKVSIGYAVISSRLAEWTQLIAGHDANG